MKHIGDYKVEQKHVKLEEYLDKKLYIQRMVNTTSNTYGDGWKLYFTLKPGGEDVMNAATFSKTICDTFDAIWKQSGEKNPFSEADPLECKIVRRGRSLFVE